jgi:hypothetical protein
MIKTAIILLTTISLVFLTTNVLSKECDFNNIEFGMSITDISLQIPDTLKLEVLDNGKVWSYTKNEKTCFEIYGMNSELSYDFFIFYPCFFDAQGITLDNAAQTIVNEKNFYTDKMYGDTTTNDAYNSDEVSYATLKEVLESEYGAPSTFRSVYNGVLDCDENDVFVTLKGDLQDNPFEDAMLNRILLRKATQEDMIELGIISPTF